MEFNATFFVTAISFILFTYIMNKIFYTPITKIIDEREGFINNAINEANDSNNKAEALQKDKESRLNAAAEKSRKIVAAAAEDASNQSEELTTRAKQEANLKIAEGKKNIKSESEQSRENLKPQIKELAEIIATKILQSDTQIEEIDDELLDRTLA